MQDTQEMWRIHNLKNANSHSKDRIKTESNIEYSNNEKFCLEFVWEVTENPN